MDRSLRIRIWILIIFLLIVFMGSGVFVRLYTDWLWFQEVGFTQIFSIMLWTKVLLAVIQMLLFFIVVWGNIKIAQHFAPQNLQWYDEKTVFLKDVNIPVKRIYRILFYIVLFLSFLTGTGSSYQWSTVLYYLHPSSFGIQDPIFHRDIGFYVFTMPFYKFVVDWLFTTLIFALIGTIVVYVFNQAIWTKSHSTFVRDTGNPLPFKNRILLAGRI